MKKIKIYGAPGTGKTSEMLRLLDEELNNGTKLSRIAFVTHTVAARDEARKRATDRFPHVADADFRFFRTIHGICYLQIGLSRANVIQTEDYIEFGDYASIPFSQDFTEAVDEDGIPLGFNHSPGNEILAIRQLAAALGEHPLSSRVMEFYPSTVVPAVVEDVLDKYAKFKTKKTKFDFVDMLEMYMQDNYHPLDIDVMFIDEAQDLSRKQWQVVNKMMREAKRVYLAGDDDQSIYGFIGADPTGFYHYAVDESRILPVSHRLPRNIWDLARRIIGGVAVRQDKQIECRAGGNIDYWNRDPSLIEIDPSSTVMFIARHHNQLTYLSRLLEQRGTPFTHRGRSVAGSLRARAVHAYFRAREGAAVPVRLAAEILSMAGMRDQAKALKNIARVKPAEEIKSELLGLNFEAPWVEYLAQNKSDLRQNDNLRQILNQRGLDSIVDKPKIDLTTYHGSKGREADHVILLSDCYQAAWDHAGTSPDDERRIAFVGVTRAKKNLTIVAPLTSLYMRSLTNG